MSEAISDKQLLDEIKHDSESAYHQLFQKYYTMLCYHAYKTYPDQHKVKDFAQDVFMDIWKKRKELQIHTSLPAYLRRAVTNKSIDYIRSQRFNFNTVPDKKVEVIQENLEFSQLEEAIKHAVDSLPEKCKIVFSLSRYEGLKHKEIAEKLGISVKTIENQITKALKVLRVAVNNYRSDYKVILIFLISLIGDLHI